MSQWLGEQKRLWTGLIVVTSLLFFYAFASFASAIATGYTSSDNGIQTGMAVSLANNGPNGASVERASQADNDNIVGIVTTVDASLISVGSGSSTVFVENQGQVDAYVSDINGVIETGDLLTLSPLKGILMRLGESSLPVVGVAASGPEQTSAYNYDEGGENKETQIAKVKVNLDYQGAQAGSSSSNSPLAKLGRSLVGKEVSETRVLIALVLFVIVLIAEGAIIYGAISSAITSLGRNPLASPVIRSELTRVVVVALMVLFVGLGAVYAVLWV